MLYSDLKARHRDERGSQPRGLALRAHRALSRLDRAEQCGADHDARFIFLWISFNAAYAREVGSESSQTERERLHTFLGPLVRADLGQHGGPQPAIIGTEHGAREREASYEWLVQR